MLEELKLLKNKVLADCSPEYAFWTCNGLVVRNVYELVNSIEAMNDITFRYHVNEDRKKNDFALWIKAVFNDDKLALKLEGIIDKERYIQFIKNRIKELESIKS